MKKRTLTLLEIMIVIFLITLVTGTIGYSMRGTLDKGRAFKTEQAKEQLYDLLMICLADRPNQANNIAQNPATYLKELGLAKNPDKLILDGWKQPFTITTNQQGRDFKIRSDALISYYNRTGRNSSGDIKTPSDDVRTPSDDTEG